MTNKEASEKFGVPKNTISTWMKKKDKQVCLSGLKHLNILVHDMINLLYYEYWTDKQKYFYVYKDKLFEGLEQSSSDAKKMRGCDYEQVDQAAFKWFSLQRSQNVPIEKVLKKKF